jgi:hypothetical protein
MEKLIGGPTGALQREGESSSWFWGKEQEFMMARVVREEKKERPIMASYI